MGGQSFNGPRGNMWLFDPADLVVIGIDTGDGPEHPLYDKRVKLPVAEPLVLNIMALGILEPIIVRKGATGKPEVVDGRQRVRASREANERLRAAGKEPLRVPAVVRRGDQRSLFGVSISANELRQGDQVLAKAEKAQRYLDMGYTEDEAAVAFGVTGQSISNWLKLLELSPVVRDAISSGAIRASAAIALHGSSFEEQEAVLAKMTDAGAKPTQRTVQKERDQERPVPPSRRVLAKLVDVRRSQRHVEGAFLIGIQYAMGLVKPERVPGLTSLLREIEAEKKKPQKAQKKVKV